MYRKILVAYNGTPESRLALQECIRLEPGPATEIHLLAVITPQPVLLIGEFAAAAIPSEEEERAERQAMEDVLESGRSYLADAGLRVQTRLETGEPADIIANMVNRLGIDLVIVGHSRHKPFALRWWRGSMDALLVEKVRCSVLVAGDPQRS
ncbi:universal stress protein [Noviherbaspirillum massiliense]|uniref:universal stress protein n=1 Tax=Noviherbaspirillum massiliense TaxID=1465823 RepID=UPI0002DAA2B2|nr:universal stress protein [Noviherbaspirillum massiliense]